MFQEGDMVYLKLQLYRQSIVFKRVYQKISRTFFSLYRVLKRVVNVAYKIQLPEGA